MNVAVHFDDQEGLVAIKVYDVVADRVLPSELCIANPAVSEGLPQLLFCRCKWLAQVAGSSEILARGVVVVWLFCWFHGCLVALNPGPSPTGEGKCGGAPSPSGEGPG